MSSHFDIRRGPSLVSTYTQTIIMVEACQKCNQSCFWDFRVADLYRFFFLPSVPNQHLRNDMILKNAGQEQSNNTKQTYKQIKICYYMHICLVGGKKPEKDNLKHSSFDPDTQRWGAQR